MPKVEIRRATLADSEAIARLVSELGYPASSSQMHRRLQAILDDEAYHTLVACENGQIVGFVGACTGALYEDDGQYGQVMALAVAPNHQRRGVGRILMRAVESRLVERGARVLVVSHPATIGPMRTLSTRVAATPSLGVVTKSHPPHPPPKNLILRRLRGSKGR